MSSEKIQIAIDLYDRHLPLLDGTLQPDEGPEIEFLEVGMVPPRRHGSNRHRRMLVEREFTGAEVSLASYLVAREQGMTDMIALPLFPRRLFSHNHIFVSDKAGIETPIDLVGKRIVIWAFQVTMSVLAKGDLKRDYNVDWRDIQWIAQHHEEVSRKYDSDLNLILAEPGFDVIDALISGSVDAYINPHPPEAIMTPGHGISRLFMDGEETSRNYIRNHGYFPIMHVLALKTSALERYPNLANELYRIFDTAKSIARDFYIDPNFSMVVHARNTLEQEERISSEDLWQSGLTSTNLRNLEDFMGFCVEQGILDRVPCVDDVFHLN